MQEVKWGEVGISVSYYEGQAEALRHILLQNYLFIQPVKFCSHTSSYFFSFSCLGLKK